ncbi:MAG: short chain dehydrogenase [Candidatus Aeolococcus gillhamiae]|uniref:Short chain dehydrogenase n=1 Tax=Candidatus Aeolococcus gillhamiae TaxID=3127015 RepID=A0A2W5ZA85_9BACT|nr:MAG: short chain dehydrogenase [Candidatus Dormibacter sp. RRmetagenome_bin12]
MQYFVTGATGFIGKQLIPLLLAREGEINVLVRPGSRHRFAALRDRLDPQGTRLRAVFGDIAERGLAMAAEDRNRLRGATVFHLAAVYDLTASEDDTARANIDGTHHTVEFANAIGAARLHHVSSIAVAGRFNGVFTEQMFAEGQELDHPYFSTKYEAERIVRDEATVPWRVYRPGMVIGSAETGEADRIDGPYYAFKLIQTLRSQFPQWAPFVGPEGGPLNLVPVDFVARAMDHIAHLDGLDNRAFHLVDPKPLSLGDTLNTFCRAAHAPEFALRFDRRMTKMIPGDTLKVVGDLPAIKRVRQQVLDRLGIPETALEYMDYPATFDAAQAQEALAGSGIRVPHLHDYAWKVWDYWERHLDPDLPTAHNIRRVAGDKVVVITGASSGIGRAVASALAGSGATIIGVARGVEKLEEMKAEVEALGGTVQLRPTDLSDPAACKEMLHGVIEEHGRVDVLINNAGRSIRRSVMDSLDRFHDFERTMQLNYFGAIALIMAALPSMSQRGSGHIINITSIGGQTYPPRFAAYVASKAALDAYSRCLAPEVAADGVDITTVHMPLVRTPMIAPTGIYKNFPTISPEEAAEMVVQAMITRPHEVSTRLGKFGELTHATAPGLHNLIMSAAYHMLPDSGGRSKDKDGEAKEEAPVTAEAYALGMLMRGIHL